MRAAGTTVAVEVTAAAIEGVAATTLLAQLKTRKRCYKMG
jgi:hypothetical protein